MIKFLSKMRFIFGFSLVLLFAFSSQVATVLANNTYHDLCAGNFSQDWSNPALITTLDDWSGVPSIIGYRGDDITTATGADPQTLLGEGTITVDVNINQLNPNTFGTGGVTEFDIADDVVALTGSGTADAPNIVIHLNTTGATNISVSYNARDIDASTDNTNQQIATQYRVGTSGLFTNIAAGYIADASSGPSLATLVTPVSITLPVGAENQSQVQVRVMTTNAASTDEWIGIDDIVVSATCGGDTTPPQVSSTTPADAATGIANNSNIDVTFDESVTTSAGWYTVTCTTSGNVTVDYSNTIGTALSHSLTYTGTGLVGSEVCTVTLTATAITDGAALALDGNGDGTGGDDDSFSFTIALADPAPMVSSTTPLDNATGVSETPTISISFSESVTVSGTWFTVVCNAVDLSSDFTADSGPTTYTLTYTGTGLAQGANCVVTLTASAITDSASQALDGDTNGTGGDDYSFDFTIISINLIHDIQGNGATVTGAGPFTVRAIVTGDYQLAAELDGFFIQEEDADVDADPLTSEGIFVYCNTCPTNVAVGDLVEVTGAANDNFGQSQITASTAGAVSIISTGNPLPSVTTLDITTNLVSPLANKDSFYEPFEGMRVSLSDTMSIAEYFELFRFGELVLYQGGRPYTYTHVDTSPTAGEYTTYQDDLTRRRIVLDDGSDTQNRPLSVVPQQLYYPYPTGFGTGAQGTNYFRGGDSISGLTGILGYGFSEWRLQPTQSSYTFTPVNTRPSTPVLAGNIHVASFNVLNYFTTIDTTSSSSSGPCGPSANQDCRGADSAAELVRQTDKLVQALSAIDADIFGFLEIENSGTTVASLVTSLNAVVGAGTYDYINTGVVGTDAITVAIIYKVAVVSPLGTPLVDTNAINNRPTVAQTFEVIDAANPDFGAVFTVVVNHFKSKGSACGAGDDDTTTGQGNCNGTRVQQATQLLAWISGTVIPTSGDNDVLVIGDLNSNRGEDPINTLLGGGFTNLVDSFVGANAYSYVFDGQLGYLDHALGNATMTAQVVGIADWHINADEVPVFDYNDELKETGEAAFEEEPDGNPLYEVNPYRTSDHDPVLIALDLDAEPPTLLTVENDSAVNIPNGTTLNSSLVTVNGLVLGFSEELEAGTGVTGADNALNYYLIAGNGTIDTALNPKFCTTPTPTGNDTLITVSPVFNPATFETTLTLGTSPLPEDYYVLVACGSTGLVDLAGNALDGDSDGLGGDEAFWLFRIAPPSVVTPPLVALVRIAGSITGVINSNNVRTIQVLFDKAVRDAGIADVDSVTNPDNFILFHAGTNGLLDTNISPFPANFCALGGNPVGDDIKISFSGVSYNATSYNTSLQIQNAFRPLAEGNYLLVVCGSTSILDTNLLPLDGDGDGVGGDDFATTFRVIHPVVGGGTGGGAGTGTATGSSGTGTIVEGGIDYDGDGLPDVSQLPATGESPLWANWIIWAGALLLLASFGLLTLGSKKR